MSSSTLAWYSKALREEARRRDVDPDEFADTKQLKTDYESAQAAVRKQKLELKHTLAEYHQRMLDLNEATAGLDYAKRKYDRETVWQLMSNFGLDDEGKRVIPKRPGYTVPRPPGWTPPANRNRKDDDKDKDKDKDKNKDADKDKNGKRK